MSYALFDKGFTAEQIKGRHKPTHDELMMEKMRKWAESEHVLSIVRNIKAWNKTLDEAQAELWAKATRRRR